MSLKTNTFYPFNVSTYTIDTHGVTYVVTLHRTAHEKWIKPSFSKTNNHTYYNILCISNVLELLAKCKPKDYFHPNNEEEEEEIFSLYHLLCKRFEMLS